MLRIDMNINQNYEEKRRMNKKYAHTTFNEQKVCIHKKKKKKNATPNEERAKAMQQPATSRLLSR